MGLAKKISDSIENIWGSILCVVGAIMLLFWIKPWKRSKKEDINDIY